VDNKALQVSAATQTSPRQADLSSASDFGLESCGNDGNLICCPTQKTLPQVTVDDQGKTCAEIDSYECVAQQRCRGGRVLADKADNGDGSDSFLSVGDGNGVDLRDDQVDLRQANFAAEVIITSGRSKCQEARKRHPRPREGALKQVLRLHFKA